MVSFAAAMPEERTQFHHALPAEHSAARKGYQSPTPLAPIIGVVQARASIMSDLDIFWLLDMLGLCLRPLALFVPWTEKGGAAAQ